MNAPKPRSQYLLVFSFGLLLLVLTALMALGMTRIESFNQQLNELRGGQWRRTRLGQQAIDRGEATYDCGRRRAETP